MGDVNRVKRRTAYGPASRDMATWRHMASWHVAMRRFAAGECANAPSRFRAENAKYSDHICLQNKCGRPGEPTVRTMRLRVFALKPGT